MKGTMFNAGISPSSYYSMSKKTGKHSVTQPGIEYPSHSVGTRSRADNGDSFDHLSKLKDTPVFLFVLETKQTNGTKKTTKIPT